MPRLSRWTLPLAAVALVAAVIPNAAATASMSVPAAASGIGLGLAPGAAVPAAVASLAGVNTTAPARPVRLVFVHHSVGENWLADGYGGLGRRLASNNYAVSDTNYGWGPRAIGDRTDIPNWQEWFRSRRTPAYMRALFAESGQHSEYSRLRRLPRGTNRIVVFKSCFPNSSLSGRPTDPPTSGTDLTVGNAKWTYNQVLKYFATKPDTLFVVVTAPPNSDQSTAANARAFNDWLVGDWLRGYRGRNVAVFDFYNVLTGPENHHRVRNGRVQHVATPGMDTTYYPSDDDHPNAAGSRKATGEFVPMLNAFYHRWRGL